MLDPSGQLRPARARKAQTFGSCTLFQCSHRWFGLCRSLSHGPTNLSCLPPLWLFSGHFFIAFFIVLDLVFLFCMIGFEPEKNTLFVSFTKREKIVEYVEYCWYGRLKKESYVKMSCLVDGIGFLRSRGLVCLIIEREVVECMWCHLLGQTKINKSGTFILGFESSKLLCSSSFKCRTIILDGWYWILGDEV